MIRIFLLCSLLVAAGCTAPPRMPASVRIMPDDCANQQAIVRYLDQLAGHPRAHLQSREDHEIQRREIKARIWHLRYRCNPVH